MMRAGVFYSQQGGVVSHCRTLPISTPRPSRTGHIRRCPSIVRAQTASYKVCQLHGCARRYCSFDCVTLQFACWPPDHNEITFASMQTPSSAPAATELDLLEEYTVVVPNTVSVKNMQNGLLSAVPQPQEEDVLTRCTVIRDPASLANLMHKQLDIGEDPNLIKSAGPAGQRKQRHVEPCGDVISGRHPWHPAEPRRLAAV